MITSKMYARTLYRVMVAYERIGREGWETVEEPVMVDAWNEDDAHSDAFRKMAKSKFNVEIKSVTPLSQASYMRFIGAPMLFEMAG